MAIRRWRARARESRAAERPGLSSVRGVAIGLGLAMVLAGIWVILTDRPRGNPGDDLIGLTEQCSGTAHIGVSNYRVQLDLTTSGYWLYGYVTVTGLPRGDGHCQLAAPIPNDATHVGGQGFHTESTSAPPRVVSAVASISATSDLRLPVEIGFQYFSPSVDHDGWGETGFKLPTQRKQIAALPGELVSAANGKVVFGSRSVPLPENVTVSCPPGSDTLSAYPA